MAGHSVAVDFWVDPEILANPVERNSLIQDLLPFIETHTGKLSEVSFSTLKDKSFFSLYSSDTMSLAIKMYTKGLVSCTVEYYTDDVNTHKIVNDDGRKLEKELRKRFACKVVKVLPAIKRAPAVNPYFTTSDDRLLEYDVEELAFNDVSDFQKVQIFKTKSFGKLLVLDDLQNLSEADLSYTHSLMNKDKEDYMDKEVLILGGGDGALLWELLKEKPRFVTMIDIDDMVMKACQNHMQSVCGSCLDEYAGENYKVIVGDAVQYMRQYIEEGRHFDFVFGDLTDIPISPVPRGDVWDFIRNILELAMQLLKPSTGKYMTHAISIHCHEALAMFEKQFSGLTVPVSLNRTSCYIPSFMEEWCFFQAIRQS